MTDFIKTLPENYAYRLSEFTGHYSSMESNFKAVFHASLRAMNDVTDWINAFSRQTQTNWNVRDTHKKLQILQRKDFVCHMKDFCNRPKKFAKSSHRYKHCDCPATIKFKIKQVNQNSCRRYNWVRDGMPTTVIINNNHNHAVLSAEALSFRRIDPITRNVFNSYFDQGMSPTAASDFHIRQLDLNSKAKNGRVSRAADASLNPTRSTVAYLYMLWRLGKHCLTQADSSSDVSTPQTSLFSSAEQFNSPATQTVDPIVIEPKENRENAVQQVLSRWKDLSAQVESALHKHTNSCDVENLLSGISRLEQKLSNVHTGSQLCSFFWADGAS